MYNCRSRISYRWNRSATVIVNYWLVRVSSPCLIMWFLFCRNSNILERNEIFWRDCNFLANGDGLIGDGSHWVLNSKLKILSFFPSSWRYYLLQRFCFVIYIYIYIGGKTTSMGDMASHTFMPFSCCYTS